MNEETDPQNRLAETIEAEILETSMNEPAVPAYLLSLKDKEPLELEDTFFNLTKPSSANLIGEQLIYAIKEGFIDPVKAGVILKRFEKIQKVVFADEDCKRIITDETLKYMVGKTADVHGAVVVAAATKTFYDYSNCNHIELNAWIEIEELAKRKRKEIEDGLKDLQKTSKKSLDTIPTLKFKVDDGGIDIAIRTIPEIVFQDLKSIDEDTGEELDYRVIHVTPPKKIQNDGIKYNNL